MTLTSWSYSTLSMWQQCPRRVYFAKIGKIKAKKSAALQKGVDLHAVCEAYLKGKISEKEAAKQFKSIYKEQLTDRDLQKNIEELSTLKNYGAKSEQQLSFNRAWETTQGWESSENWLRMAIDVEYKVDRKTHVVIDFKSGKLRSSHAQQLELYGLAVLITKPSLETVLLFAYYLDRAEYAPFGEVRRVAVEKLKLKWDQLTGKMFLDTEFIAKPGPLCKWCEYSKLSGGPCDKG